MSHSWSSIRNSSSVVVNAVVDHPTIASPGADNHFHRVKRLRTIQLFGKMNWAKKI